MPKKALLLSAYDAESHRHWHQLLVNRIEQYEWTVITLPAHHFFWRVRSNGLSFALEHRKRLTAAYDVLIATSMIDLATLRGLVPELASVPALIYFHENQFEYPIRDAASESRILNAQFSSIVTALCAKRVLFNSQYNRRSFLSGTKRFIERMPDGLSPKILDNINSKSAVLPVPIHVKADARENCGVSETENDRDSDANHVDLVWAHRWEYDKQPEVFFDALEKLYDMPDFLALQMHIRLHVMGQSFREVPDCFQRAQDSGIHNFKTWGYQRRDDYYRILASSNFVVSTALHDFQGLGMIEAIHRGCVPIAPNRVAYPEYIPEEFLYKTGQPDEESTALALKLCQILSNHIQKNTEPSQTSPDVSRYLENQLICSYELEISALYTG